MLNSTPYYNREEFLDPVRLKFRPKKHVIRYDLYTPYKNIRVIIALINHFVNKYIINTLD